MRHLTFFPLFAILTCLGPIGPAWADDLESATDPSNVIERFKVAKDGDCLLLPVKFKEKSYLFLLDTGSTLNMFDSSLPLGEPLGSGPGSTPNGSVFIEYHMAPKASIGSLNLRTDDPVIAFDFTKIREATGYEIYGVVGMSFLSRQIVRIDFDKGELLFLRAAGKECGEALDLSYTEKENPVVSLSIRDVGNFDFMIDTGCIGGSDLGRKVFHAALKKEAMTLEGRTTVLSASGITSPRQGWLKQVSVGEFMPRGLMVTRAEGNTVGLGFCSRFIVTFDFPQDKLYLQKGLCFDKEDARGSVGVNLLRREGKTIVESVYKESAAERAGIKKGDILVRIGDVHVERVTMFELGPILHQEGKTLAVTVLRDGEKKELSLVWGQSTSSKK
jgi:hypothetical protein